MALTEAERAKRLKLYKNGDLKFYGKDFVLNKRRIRTWEAFLQSVTLDLKTNEAVRSIRTPTTGTYVKNLEDLEDNRQYVAVGNGRFRKAGYLNLHEDRPKPVIYSPRTLEPLQVRPVEHNRRLQVSGRIRKIPTDVLTIFVYANGRDLEPARRLTITHKMMLSWDSILALIDDKVPLLAGACRRVYSTEGHLIHSPNELHPNSFYVAVGSEIGGFRRLDYGARRPAFNNSPQRARKRLEPLAPRPRKSRKSYNSEPVNGTEHSVSSNSDRAKSEGRSPARKPRYRDRSYNRQLPKKQEDGVFHAKPVKHRRSRDESKPVDYDKDEGGVFKAKGRIDETKGAEEVEETKDTHVDLPIDQVEAEEVKDEDIEYESHSIELQDEQDIVKRPSDEEEYCGDEPASDLTEQNKLKQEEEEVLAQLDNMLLDNETKEKEISVTRQKEPELSSAQSLERHAAIPVPAKRKSKTEKKPKKERRGIFGRTWRKRRAKKRKSAETSRQLQEEGLTIPSDESLQKNASDQDNSITKDKQDSNSLEVPPWINLDPSIHSEECN